MRAVRKANRFSVQHDDPRTGRFVGHCITLKYFVRFSKVWRPCKMKKFTLDKGILRTPILEIDEATGSAASGAKKVIIAMLTAEEKYDAVIENFVEFERDLLDITLEYQMFGGRTEDWFNTARNQIDRRFFNLLSACRSYIEFGTHCSNEIASNKAALKEERSRHFDQSLAYELMEGLRNEITYAGHAAHIVTFSSSREDIGDDDFVLNYATPTFELLTERLQENHKLPKKLLIKLRDQGDRISFLPLLREYIRRLSEIHDFLRSLCRADVTRARNLFENIFEMFRNAHPETEDFRGLILREYEEDEKINEFWVVAFASRIDYFEAKNRVLSNLERSRVTNAIPRND